jgi:SNF2 family DNA or RNA helicase
MNVTIRQNDIRIQTDKETAEQLGARYIKDKTYQLPKNLHAVKDLMEHSNHYELKPLYNKLKGSYASLLKLKKSAVGGPKWLDKLRPYQQQDLAFLSRLPHAGIFNEQRTGKTPTLLSLFRLHGFKRMALVVPAGLTLNWEKECAVWLPGTKVIRIRGPRKQRERAYQSAQELGSFVLILSYDTLKQPGEIDFIKKCCSSFDAIAIDEAHTLRGRTSARTKAIMKFGKLADHRYALTGTPAVRAGDDIFQILQFLYPDKFTTYWGFVERYFVMKEDYWSGGQKVTSQYARREELEDILGMLSTNRKRKDIMKWLPDKQYQTIPIELTAKQRQVYDKVLNEFQYEEDGEMKVDAPSVLAQLTRLRQICLAPSILGIKAPSAKEQFILEWLEDNTEPVIIFSQFTSYLKQLSTVIYEKLKEEVVAIHGELSGNQKQRSVEAFQNGTARILLANIEAAGTGYTLDKASTTIFLDKEWNPASNLQAEDRMVPVSKERVHKMDVISLVAEGTYDEKIDKLLQHKYDITEVINSGGLRALDRLYKELE